MINSFTGTVSLVELGNTHLAIRLTETLMIGQGSEIKLAEGEFDAVGRFEYANETLPVYFLNEDLRPSKESLPLNEYQFCIGLRTSNEVDYFVLFCKQFEQVDVSEQTHTVQALPNFMCNERMLVEGLFEHKERVYLIISPDKLLDYIKADDAVRSQENQYA